MATSDEWASMASSLVQGLVRGTPRVTDSIHRIADSLERVATAVENMEMTLRDMRANQERRELTR